MKSKEAGIILKPIINTPEITEAYYAMQNNAFGNGILCGILFMVIIFCAFIIGNMVHP